MMFFSVSDGKDVGVCDKIESVQLLGILWMEWDLADASVVKKWRQLRKGLLLAKTQMSAFLWCSALSFVCLVEFVCPFRLRSKTALSVKNENEEQKKG